LRIRANGSAGTHNGMRSIISVLGRDNFPRLRVGIGASEQGRLRDYVLDEFSADEQPVIDRAVERSIDALVLIVRGDLKRAMNQFNKDDVLPSTP
ncbi:MAG TPA: aminoacyl-tRNA hydrolase, partial [Thermoanaerobaculia bacterium]|nr:aminoacyl-tRNA hydrolase [Thermoanaerobaculia bacterium]